MAIHPSCEGEEDEMEVEGCRHCTRTLGSAGERRKSGVQSVFAVHMEYG